MIPIIDAHLDLAWNALSFDRDLTLAIDEIRSGEAGLKDHPSRGGCTVTLPELRRAGVSLCVATLLARSGPGPRARSSGHRTDLDYASPSIAHAVAQGQLSYYRLLESQGWIRIIGDAGRLKEHWEEWCASGGRRAPTGVLLGMEGTDPIVSPRQAGEWWRAGLRVAGLAHYGRSVHACGTGTDGPLTPEGRELLKEFEGLGIILDVTHLCDRSLDEALDVFPGPVLASHHNCRALVPGERQLSDIQILKLIRRGAVVGTALDAWMLHPGWERGKTKREKVGLEAVADQMDHVCQLAGNIDHAAIGSDLDGGFGIEQCPRDLETIADLAKLAGVLAARGYSDSEIAAVFHGNWLRFFLQALPRGS